MMNSVQRGAWLMAVVLAGAQLVSLPAVAVMVVAPAQETKGDPVGFAGWRARAEEQRAAGDYSASARSFASAYDALSEREQAGLKGEIAVNNAVDDFKLAQEQAPGELALLFEEAALLARFESNPQRKDVPQALANELVRVRARVAEARQAQEEEAEKEREAQEAEKQRKAREDAAKTKVESTPPQEGGGRIEPIHDESPSRRKADAAILGVGLASVVGGTALIANAVWNFAKVDRRGNELLAAHDAVAEYTDEERASYLAEVEGYQQQWRGVGTGFIVAGAVLTAAGVGLATWGAVRFRRAGQRTGQHANVAGPMVLRRGLGLAFAVSF